MVIGIFVLFVVFFYSVLYVSCDLHELEGSIDANILASFHIR